MCKPPSMENQVWGALGSGMIKMFLLSLAFGSTLTDNLSHGIALTLLLSGISFIKNMRFYRLIDEIQDLRKQIGGQICDVNRTIVNNMNQKDNI